MQAQVKHLERRYDSSGVPYVIETPEKDSIEDDKADWHSVYALCVVRIFQHDNRTSADTHVHINSAYLKRLLQKVIGNYAGQSFETKTVVIKSNAHCLYHYRHELREIGQSLPESLEETEHHSLLCDFIDDHFASTDVETKELRDLGLMSFDLLWTLFKPGVLVYAVELGQPRAYGLLHGKYIDHGIPPQFHLDLEYVDFDGDSFGKRKEGIQIPEFEGAMPITNLNAFPFHCHGNEQQIKASLTARGLLFEGLAGQSFREYSGIASDSKSWVKKRYSVQGRVMIDCKTFHRIKCNEAFTVTPLPGSNIGPKQSDTFNYLDTDLVPRQKHQYMELSDELRLITNAVVRGFSFTEKIFLYFFVDNLAPVQWNDSCFNHLVLPAVQKETVQALVAEHCSSTSSTFDDIVQGKGLGLVLVLYGPPGVGKTLTAECVAEFAHRPLYMVSSGDLGTDPEALDKRLSKILDLASTWKAVLLIDEADVFLERRSLHDLQRNALVSIFLRTLEYYSGILFMTTNRVKTFDDAFKSRIHMPLKYDDLPQSSRKTIWKNFLSKIEGGVDVDEEEYDKLSEGNLNGRAIKNIIRTAKSLSAYKKQKLGYAQLRQVMDIQTTFDKELEAGTPRSEFDLVVR